MKTLKRFIKKIIFYRQYHRLRTILSYYSKTLKRSASWIFARTETDNFYYSITESNLRDLVSAVSIVTGESPQVIERFIAEINSNNEISRQIADSWSSDPAMSDATVGLARRVGWYAVVRSSKPRLVVETGVSHGVGALVICEALDRNSSEGFPGNYIGTDINPNAGNLLFPKFRKFGRILVGDSLKSLRELEEPIDIFINDSDHSSVYEGEEYRAISRLLSPNSIILGDNSHVTDELRNYSYATGRKYLFFAEKPKDHWYPGAGIGFSFK
jgi:hypothetical protein